MYRVAYDDWWETENYFFSSKRNSEKKMQEMCGALMIAPISLNQQFPLENGHWILWEEIITEEQKQKWIFSTETKLLYNKQSKDA